MSFSVYGEMPFVGYLLLGDVSPGISTGKSPPVAHPAIYARREKPAAFDKAEIFAQLGETEKAFEWLEQGYAERTYTMMYLRVAPNLDSLRSDSRFENLSRRIRVA